MEVVFHVYTPQGRRPIRIENLPDTKSGTPLVKRIELAERLAAGNVDKADTKKD